jgi:soluble lytic murein transglycosylase-like protein
MAVAEPSNAFGLWEQVKASSYGWPQTDEDSVAALARDWGAGSGHFAAPFRTQPSAWTDDGGQAFGARMRSNLTSAAQVASGMTGLSQQTAGFAGEVAAVKTDIKSLVERNIPAYGLAGLLPAGVAAPVRNSFVGALSGAVNDRILLAANTVAAGGAWPPPLPPGVPSWGSPSGPPPSKGTAGTPAQVKAWIEEARRILVAQGVDPALMNPNQIAAMIGKESSGNPHAINLWDSNAKKGIPSKGLMQTIDPTFQQYKLPGHENIYDPVDNIIAGTRYALDRYGSISKVPGIRALESGGGYVGY